MKKIFYPSLFIALLAFGCAKKRTCTETITQTNGNVTTNVTTYDKLTPKQRKEIENFGTYTSGNGTSHKTDCK
jgi:hypothetical protein